MKKNEQLLAAFLVVVIFATAIVSITGMVMLGLNIPGNRLVVAEPAQSPETQSPAPIEPAPFTPAQLREPAEEDSDVQEMLEELEQQEEEPGLAEQYLREFREKVASYSYRVRCDVHGPLYVRVDVDTGSQRFQSLDRLFTLNEEMNEVEKSEMSNDLTLKCRADSSTYSPGEKAFFSDLEKRKANEMNTIWWVPEEQQYKGCFVTSRHVDLDHCVKDKNASGKQPVIHEGFTFHRPKTPEEVMLEFVGLEPYRIYEERAYAIQQTDSTVTAREVLYKTGDHTFTRLYVHAYYKGLLQVDVIEDGIVTDQIRYDAIEFQPRTVY